jgi:hypothetical protein
MESDFWRKRGVTLAEKSPLFEIARVQARLDHVAGRIVNANHSIV